MKIQYRKKSLKIPKGRSEATTGAIRSHHRGNQKPQKGQAEAQKKKWTAIIYKTLYRKLKIDQHEQF